MCACVYREVPLIGADNPDLVMKKLLFCLSEIKRKGCVAPAEIRKYLCESQVCDVSLTPHVTSVILKHNNLIT